MTIQARPGVERDEDCHARRRDLETLLAREYGIGHTTLQVDHVGDHAAEGTHLRFLGRGGKKPGR